jgi:hypothetical protein
MAFNVHAGEGSSPQKLGKFPANPEKTLKIE